MFGLMKKLKPRHRAVAAKPDELRARGLALVFNFIVLGSYS
jgi:hypothetical protein